MKTKSTPDKEDAVAIKKLVTEIAKEQQKLDRYEGDAIACQIRIAARLAKLREQAKRTWGKQLNDLGISPRVASRYLKIAQHWPDEIGLSESDLLRRLPPDLLKLEWLCRVPLAGLPTLLDKLDCKKAARSEVIVAVREALGEDSPAPQPEAEEFVNRLVQRLKNSIAQLGEKFPNRHQQELARTLLATGLRDIQQALEVETPPTERTQSDDESIGRDE